MMWRTTVMVVKPGYRSLTFEFPGLWPYAVVLCMLSLLGIGVAVQRCHAMWQNNIVASIGMVQTGGAGSGQKRQANHNSSTKVGSSSSAKDPNIAKDDTPAIEDLLPSNQDVFPLPRTALALEPVAHTRMISAKEVMRAFKRHHRMVAGVEKERAEELAAGELRLHILHSGERLRVKPFDDKGRPDPKAFAAIRHAMRCRVTGWETAIDPRLVRLLIQISTAYDRTIQVISGYRAPHANGTSETSQHTLGRAADIRIVGETSIRLGRFARKLGARGVGLYRSQNFVHVDVRNKPRYFWVEKEEEKIAADSVSSEPGK